MIKEGLSKYNITRSNSHLLDVFSPSSYIELGSISFDVMDKLLHYEVVRAEELTYLPIQNRGVGKCEVNSEILRNRLPFLFFENLNLKNRAMQIFLTYGLLKFKDDANHELFSPILLIPVNIYFEKDGIFFQQISRPVENPILMSYLTSVKNLSLSIPERLDDVYAIDKFCMGLEKHDSLHLELENYLTFAVLKEHEIRIKTDKFVSPKEFDDYLYDRLYDRNHTTMFYLNTLNRAQRHVVHSAETGSSFIVTGRLGTGKTTAMVNIAINAMNKGKRVLYISNMKATLDAIYQLFESRHLYQYVTNFADLFAGFHQGELITSPKAFSAKEELESLFENYKFINDYENAMASRILDQRFMDIVNELTLLTHVPHQLLAIDDLSSLYKAEFNEISNSLEIIQTSLSKLKDFKNNIWKDIPIINSIKYPNQIVSLIYQIHKCFKILDSEKQVLEADFGFRDLANYAYLKNIIHGFKNLNIREVPESWKEPTNKSFTEAQEQFRNLKNEIFQLQETENFVKYKYEDLEGLDIKQEIALTLGQYFTEDDFESVDKINEDRMILVVLINKCLMQIDILKKSVEKARTLLDWNFPIEDAVISELIKLSAFLHQNQTNNRLLKIITDGAYEEIYPVLQDKLNEITAISDELNGYLRFFPNLDLYDLGGTIELLRRYQIDDQTLTAKDRRFLSGYQKKQPKEFLELMELLPRYLEREKQRNALQDAFMQLTGYRANTQVMTDLRNLRDYWQSLPEGEIKTRILDYLNRFLDVTNLDYHETRAHLKTFDLLERSHADLRTLYAELHQYPFPDPKDTLKGIIDDIYVLHNYLVKVYASNDRMYKATRNTTEKFIRLEEYFTLDRNLDKISNLKKYLSDNATYRHLYQDFYQASETNVSAISRLLQSYAVYQECFANPEAMIASLDPDVNEKIVSHLNRCNEISDEISEIFTVYFKIFRDDVSKYYYDSFASNIQRMNRLLQSKDELITYLIITDNLQVLNRYHFEKLIDYIINLRDCSNLVVDFKYSYLTAVKDKYLEKYPYLAQYKSLEACLKLASENETEIIRKIGDSVSRNIRKISGSRFGVSGIKNLDYRGYIHRTSGIKRLFLSPTQILNNYLDIEDFDLVIVDDAHLLSANEYHKAIEAKQVIVCGELQLQSTVVNNLISRLSFASNITLNYRFSPTPQSLLNHLHGLKGRINQKFNDNYGVEIINSKIIPYLGLLLKENPETLINLFVLSIEKQRRVFDELANVLVKMGMNEEQILLILKERVNLVDLRLSHLYDAEYNVLFLEDYYKIENEHVVVNMIDNLLLCKRRLVIYDNNDYLKRGSGYRLIEELNKITNLDQVFFKEYSSPIMEKLAARLETEGLNVYGSTNEVNLLIEKDNRLTGLLLFWNNNNLFHDTLNEYREFYLLNQKNNFKVIVIWSMELLQSVDEVVKRIVEEVGNE